MNRTPLALVITACATLAPAALVAQSLVPSIQPVTSTVPGVTTPTMPTVPSTSSTSTPFVTGVRPPSTFVTTPVAPTQSYAATTTLVSPSQSLPVGPEGATTFGASPVPGMNIGSVGNSLGGGFAPSVIPGYTGQSSTEFLPTTPNTGLSTTYGGAPSTLVTPGTPSMTLTPGAAGATIAPSTSGASAGFPGARVGGF